MDQPGIGRLRKLFTGAWRHGVRVVVYGLIGGVLGIVIIAVVILEGRPDLQPWQTVHLDEEFTAGSKVRTFKEYLELEERLFAQLDAEVYAACPADERTLVNRYHRGSLADPQRWPTDWNRSIEMAAAEPRAGVLLIHGLSDAPYSMRSLAEALHARGATVLAMRVPGHGTAPSGLLRVEWQDMEAAVRLAIRHLDDQVGERPLYIVGYSNGGALAVLYALASLRDDSLPPVQGLALISPEIGISRLAVLAAWQERLGHVLGMRKISWNSIRPEYDPFQYKSFALNAGKQAHRITKEIQKRITRLGKSGDLARFPPLLAFQSVVDHTVSAPALVTGLFERIGSGAHELVLFDLNEAVAAEQLLARDPQQSVQDLLAQTDLAFTLTLVTNKDEESSSVVQRRRAPGEMEATDAPLSLAWPEQVYSLSHIALPFPPDDPLYGGPDSGPSPGLNIGNIVLRGETGVLSIPASDILRLHWNPFYEYLEQRVLEFMSLEGAPEGAAEAGGPG